MKFRKKPVVVEAMQYMGIDSITEMNTFLNGGAKVTFGKSMMLIHTLEGIMLADLGDWIIKGVEGEFYPCKPEIFKKTYEEETK